MHTFDGEEFKESVKLCTTYQIVILEELWGRIGPTLPDGLQRDLGWWQYNTNTMSFDEAFNLIAKLREMDADDPRQIGQITKHINKIKGDARIRRGKEDK